MKYVYSEKRKEVLAVEEGSPVYNAAVKKGMQLFDTEESAEEAIGAAMEAVRGLADGYRIEGDKVLKVPGSEVQGRLDRGEVVYDSEEEANAASHRVGGEGAKEPAPKLRETALRYMDRVYEGDLKKTLDALADGYSMDPLETTDEQRMFITAARRVTGARTDEEVLQALAVYPGLAERLDLEARQKEWHGYAGGPPVKAILAPNLVNRKLSGSGTLSKVVGAAEDAFSLVPRAIRAGIEETMPIADEMTFAERMAVPHELLTAPQAMFTEGLSSIAPGMATEAAGRAGMRFAGRKIPAVSRFLQKQSQLTGATEDLTKAIRGVDDALVLPKGRYVANQAANGVGEGMAFSAHPAMLEATSPDDGAVGRGVFTAAVGTAMGPLGRAAYAITPFGYKAAVRNMSDDVLSPSGRELRSGLGPYERIGSALAADERVLEKGGVPRALAPESESRLRTLTGSVDDIASARDGLETKKYRLFSDFANDLPEAPRRPMDKDEIRSFMFRAEQLGIPEEEASDLLARAQSGIEVPYLEYPGQVDVPAVYAEGPLPEVPVASTVDPEFDGLMVELGLDDASIRELEKEKADPGYVLGLLKRANDESENQALRDAAASDAARMLWEKYHPGESMLNYIPLSEGRTQISEGSFVRDVLDHAHGGWIGGSKDGATNPFIGTPREEEYFEALKLSKALTKRSVEGQRMESVAKYYTDPVARQQALDEYGLGPYRQDPYVSQKLPFANILGSFPQPVEGEKGLAAILSHMPSISVEKHGKPKAVEPTETFAPAYGPGAPVLLDPPRTVEVEGPPVQRYKEELAVDPRDLAKITVWRGLDSKEPGKYIELAQPFSYYGMPDVEFPYDRLRRIDAMLAGLPSQGKEQGYLQKIGQSRLDRLTAIEPYREAVKLQEGINNELGKDYAWDIPAVVAAYRRSQRPSTGTPTTGLVENMLAAKIAEMAPGAAGNVASGVGKSARVSAPAAGAEKAVKHRNTAGDVPQLIVIGKGGLLQAPFTPIKKFKSIEEME